MARLLAIAALSATLAAATPPIDPAVLLGHIKVLAADDMKGRSSGSPELERAAEYIATQFKTAGLKPGGAGNDWFQPFDLQAGLEIGQTNTLVMKDDGRSVELSLSDGYYPLAATPNDSAA